MTPQTSTDRRDRWHRKAVRALRAGNLDAAEAALGRLVDLAPEHADGWFLTGVCALSRGRLPVALEHLDRAIALDAGRPAFWAQRAQCLLRLGRLDEAGSSVDRALALPVADAATHDSLGHALVRFGRYADAAAQFETAARQSPGELQFQYNLATALMHCGDLAAARRTYEHVLEMDPDQGWAHVALAHLLEGEPPPERRAQLESALKRAGGDVDRELLIRHALAHTLEASGDTAAAFVHWTDGKAAKRAQLGYSIEEDRRIFAAIERPFDSAATDSRPGSPSSRPIFVLGMPRSGTTLVERILSSHSAVAAGGEMACLAQAVRNAGGGRNDRFIDVESLAPALASDPAAIGARYLECARARVGDSRHFVDKHPLNFFFVGFIQRTLPNSRVVCLHRNPLDTCLSNLRQLFALNAVYRYTLSLTDTAEYFALFERLMDRWDAWFPGAVYHLHYEALVADHETEIGRLLDFIGLDFEPAVLSFHRNAAPVSTASLVQVRRPIHRDSVNAWRRYASELGPLRARLEELGVSVPP